MLWTPFATKAPPFRALPPINAFADEVPVTDGFITLWILVVRFEAWPLTFVRAFKLEVNRTVRRHLVVARQNIRDVGVILNDLLGGLKASCTIAEIGRKMVGRQRLAHTGMSAELDRTRKVVRNRLCHVELRVRHAADRLLDDQVVLRKLLVDLTLRLLLHEIRLLLNERARVLLLRNVTARRLLDEPSWVLLLR